MGRAYECCNITSFGCDRGQGSGNHRRGVVPDGEGLVCRGGVAAGIGDGVGPDYRDRTGAARGAIAAGDR